MRKSTYILIVLVVMLPLFITGCEGSEVARQTALQLRDAVVEDEQLIDAYIVRQNQFYKDQQATIEQAREANKNFKVDAFRRMRSAQAATEMSRDPDSEARLATVMAYLHSTHDGELELFQELYGGDQKAREELKSKIAKLERQKKQLQEVKNNLTQLAVSPNSRKRAQTLLKFSQETYAAFKKANPNP